MAAKSYQVSYKMQIGQGDGFGVAPDDIPKGMDQVGQQNDWIKSSAEGLAVFQSLKGNNFDITDVGTDPVYRQNQAGQKVYWVPYAKYYNAAKARYIVRYIPLVVNPVAATADELQADLEQHKAEQQAALERMKAELELQKTKLQGEMELNKLRSDIAAMQNGGSAAGGSPYGSGSAGGLRTYEVFGLLNGQKVPLAQVAKNVNGSYQQVPNSRILVGDAPSDGFGLAGVPGAWPTLYPGQSPATFGLDADKAVLGSDGVRGWVLDSNFLTSAFGPNWRSQIYP